MNRRVGPMIRITHVVIFFLLLLLAVIVVETISHNLYSGDSGSAPLDILSEEPLYPDFRQVGL